MNGMNKVLVNSSSSLSSGVQTLLCESLEFGGFRGMTRKAGFTLRIIFFLKAIFLSMRSDPRGFGNSEGLYPEIPKRHWKI